MNENNLIEKLEELAEFTDFLVKKGLVNKKIDIDLFCGIIEYFGSENYTKKNIYDFFNILSEKVKKLAKEKGSDEDKILYRINENKIEVYEINKNEKLVKRFLGTYSLNEI